MKKIMGKFGNVEEAVNGQEALEKVKDNFYDVIVSDMGMPVLNGMDFYLKAVEIDPDIRNRFMFCSGNITPSIEDFLHEHDLKYIEKPFTIPKLQKVVQDMIDKKK
jgi:CheY-like chemotaxis protein